MNSYDSILMAAINECYAYFHVAGSFDPAEITARLGVNPTKTSIEGDLVPRTEIRRKCSRWQLHSRLKRAASLELHIADVLDQLDANKCGFQQLSRELDGTMELVGYFYAYCPGIVLEREIVERLAQYALSVDCDFYFHSKDAEDSSTAATD